MHYMAFAMQRGLVPYKQIAEINLPLSYAPDWVILSAFGTTDLAWRLYDLGLLCVVAFALYLMLRHRDKFSALWAGGLFALIHARDGIEQMGQRDLTGTALILLAAACLVNPLKADQWKKYASFGLCIGIAASVKPTLAPFLLLPIADLKVETESRLVRRMLIAIAAFFIPIAVWLIWLQRHHALSAFIDCMDTLSRFHAAQGKSGFTHLLHSAFSPLLPLLYLWVAVVGFQLCERSRRTIFLETFHRERILWLGSLLGLLSYLLQQKGFPYQRYPFIAFFLLLICTELSALLNRRGLQRGLATTALIWTSFILAPSSAWKASCYDWQHREFVSMLSSDLQEASGGDIGSLSGHVMCIDSVSGCVETLYKLKLLESSRTMYDEFLFPSASYRAVALSRNIFWQDVQTPPRVLILSSDLFPSGPLDYGKIGQWPEFQIWLQNFYQLKTERTPGTVHSVGHTFAPPGYRLYIRR